MTPGKQKTFSPAANVIIASASFSFNVRDVEAMKQSRTIFKRFLLQPVFWAVILLAAVSVYAQDGGLKIYREAKTRYDQKKFEEAALLFQKYIDSYPDADYTPESYYYLAGLQEDFELTKAFYQKIIDDFPQSRLVDDAYYQLGMTQLLTGQNERALESFKKLLEAFPTSPWSDKAQYQYGKTKLVLNRIAEAKTAFQKLVREYPGSPEIPLAIIGLADCFKKENLHYEALKELLGFDKLYPESDLQGLVYFNIAECYRALGDNEKADSYYQKVVSLYPDSFEAEEANKRILSATEESAAYFSVQLGAFSKMDNARRLKEKMIDKGFKGVHVEVLKRNNAVLYLVRVGHFRDKAPAEKLLRQLRREERLTPRIVFNPAK